MVQRSTMTGYSTRAVIERMVQCAWLLCATYAHTLAAQSSGTAPQALVYPKDPEQTPQPELVTLPLAPDAQPARGLHHAWLAVHSCSDAGESRMVTTAQGEQRVRVCSIIQSATPDANGRFGASPSAANAPAADPFAEQMLFYHGARTLQYFASLGLPRPLASPQLQLIANVRLPAADVLQPWRDASFLRADEPAGALDVIRLPGLPAAYFGQDRDVRVAYDSAAIRHEVAHAALAAWLPRQAWFVDAQGTNSAPAAIAEALADYFAASMADDPRLGAHVAHGSDQLLTRNLNTRLDCPAALSGTAHQDGMLIASALWAARQELGGALDQALAAALKKLRAPAHLSSEKLLQSVLVALGVRQSTAAKIFRERGLLPACQRILNLDPQQSFSGNTGKLTVPGATSTYPLASSVLQLRAALPAGATQAELRMRAGPTDDGFQPALLVSSAPIRWTASGSHDGALVTAAASGSAGELRFVLPQAKAQTLYVQVVNRGQRAGWFDAVRVIIRH
jgi:hypothetical protein